MRAGTRFNMPLQSKWRPRSWEFGFALCVLFMSSLLVAAGEPEYETKPVSHWLAILKNPSASATNRESIRVAFRQARTALLSIGPAALPYLAEDLDDRESVLARGYRKLRSELPPMVAQRLPDPRHTRRIPDSILNQYFRDITLRAGTNAIPVLIQLSSSPAAKIRRTAVWSLRLVAGLDPGQVIPVFAKGAFDADYDVSGESLDALCLIAPWDVRVEPILAEYLRSDRSKSFKRNDAIMALGIAAKSSRSGFLSVRSVTGTNRWERAYATFADWQRFPTVELGEQVIASFRLVVESPQEDIPGAQSLSWLNDYLRPTATEREMAARVFATALRDSDEEIRRRAAGELGELGAAVRVVVPALAEALQDPSEEVRDSALGALRDAGEEARSALPRIIELLNNPAHRWRAASLLERIGPGASDAIPALTKAARRGDALERRAPLDALAAIAPRDPRVRDTLLRSLRDRHYEVRWSAADALGIAKDSSRSVIDALEHTFNNDEVIEVRLAAARAMLDVDPGLGPGLVAPLGELLGMMEPDSGQSRTARLLGRIGPQASSADAALTGLLNHQHPNVRVAAAEALARVKPDRKAQSAALLRDLLQHGQPSTRMAAAKALWRLSPEDAQKIATVATELLSAQRDIQPEDAARLLGEMGPEARSALPRLQQVVESASNRATRRAAWQAIEAIRGATLGE